MLEARHKAALEVLKANELKPVVDAFILNTLRAEAMYAFPIVAAGWGFNSQRIQIIARARLGLDPFAEPPPDRFLEYMQLQQQVFAEMLNNDARIDEAVFNGGKGVLTWISQTAPAAHEKLVSGMQASLASILLHCWTAFESAATDIWVAAVNAKPSLGIKAFDKKEIPIASLARYRFSVATELGSYLRSHDYGPFISLDKLSALYRRTFGSKAGNAFREAKHLKTFKMLRNVFIHKAGEQTGI